MKIFRFSVIFLLLCGCTPVVTISPEPAHHAWWLRAAFNPKNRSIRGIPVEDINQAWEKVYELNEIDIPKEYVSEFGGDSFEKNNVAFSVDGDFNNDGIKDYALVGVYQSYTNDKGSFLLVLSRDENESYRVQYVSYWKGSSNFSVLDTRAKDSIKVWHCMYCGDGTTYMWSNDKKTYIIEFGDDYG